MKRDLAQVLECSLEDLASQDKTISEDSFGDFYFVQTHDPQSL